MTAPRGPSVIASSCNSALAISPLPSHLPLQSFPPTPRVKNSLCACKIPSFARLRRHWSLLEQVDLGWRREWSSSFALSLSLSLALPSPFFRTFFLNLTVPTCACTQERASERAQENREDKRALFSLAVRPTDRPTARAAPALSPGPFLASCGRVDSKRRKDGESSAGERGRGKTVLPFCRRCAR